MVSLEVIEREIDELMARETSYKVCERLSWLMTVRDHLLPSGGHEALAPRLTGSDFLDAASGKPYEAVLKVIDEHLDTVRLMFPTTYENVVQQVRNL